MADEETSKWIDRIEKLMAKANDPATSPEEAQSVMEKVYKLMAKFSIEETMLNFNKQTNYTEVIRYATKLANPFASNRSALLSSVALLFGVRIIRMRDGETHVLYGYKTDIERTVLLFGSLTIQMLYGLNLADHEARPKGMHRRTFSSSWLYGFTMSVHERIVKVVETVKNDIRNSTTGNGMEVALLDKDKQIALAIQQEFPRLVRGRRTAHRVDGDVYDHGRNAGANADLGQSRMGNRREISAG